MLVIKSETDGRTLVTVPTSTLRGADLRRAKLGDANLAGMDLRGAKLGAADLTGANLSGADLRGCDLHAPAVRDYAMLGFSIAAGFVAGLTVLLQMLTERNPVAVSGALVLLALAVIQRPAFRSARLDCANLRGAHLEGADLRGVGLQGADLVGCVYDRWTRWASGIDPAAHGAVPAHGADE